MCHTQQAFIILCNDRNSHAHDVHLQQCCHASSYIPHMSFHYHINVIAYAGQNIKFMREARRTSA